MAVVFISHETAQDLCSFTGNDLVKTLSELFAGRTVVTEVKFKPTAFVSDSIIELDSGEKFTIHAIANKGELTFSLIERK